MIVIKLIGKTYNKNEIQENSVMVRKWFALQCMANRKFDLKYYEIEENNDIVNQ